MKPVKDRKKFLSDTPNYLRHQASGCLIRGGEIVSIYTLERDIDHLVQEPPVIMLRVVGDEELKKTLLYFRLYNNIQFLLVDAPVFAYEPILRCLQEKSDLPLSSKMLAYRRGDVVAASIIDLGSIVERLRTEGANSNIQGILNTKKATCLEQSQLKSFLSGLTQKCELDIRATG
ncbi:hypothetical protein BDV29DRAFT_161355 [Aspergillus leporis]|jgi:hypothetical protein|uniref:Uncharacterized protein n=1 Tax=Aspergillus leporis TaxID=41062 RepID=A0A5N5WLU8_9EURO|nr:hypothetical protein BDV29DRAFT_161355 [Aspergillus leporis]